MNKAVLLDRDGVINIERGDYTYLPEDFVVIDGVAAAINLLKKAGYFVIIITNQAGIAKMRYTVQQMKACHQKMQKECSDQIDAVYYAPLHPSVSESLARKPGSLMFERAIAKFNLDPKECWMVGDKQRDLDPAKSLGIKTIGVGSLPMVADHLRQDLWHCVDLILEN
jgi:D-glycero-D-manno-heptose 1,7-bisphosphate phosphatase